MVTVIFEELRERGIRALARNVTWAEELGYALCRALRRIGQGARVGFTLDTSGSSAALKHDPNSMVSSASLIEQVLFRHERLLGAIEAARGLSPERCDLLREDRRYVNTKAFHLGLRKIRPREISDVLDCVKVVRDSDIRDRHSAIGPPNTVLVTIRYDSRTHLDPHA